MTIQELNDRFRSTFCGGLVNITSGVAALSEDVRAEVLSRVREFKHFNGDNDPHQEHDFGSFKIGSETFFWKIDYYDRTMESGSEDPNDPGRTTRVLTVMLASEY